MTQKRLELSLVALRYLDTATDYSRFARTSWVGDVLSSHLKTTGSPSNHCLAAASVLRVLRIAGLVERSKDESGFVLWQITDAGRKWLADHDAAEKEKT